MQTSSLIADGIGLDPPRTTTLIPTTNGWVMPVATNVFRMTQLQTDVDLPGIHTLSLSGDAFRVWQSAAPATNDVPLLVSGQTVTNGVNGVTWGMNHTANVYIQAVTNGTATLTYSYIGTGSASGIVCRASLKLTAGCVEIQSVYEADAVYNRIPNSKQKTSTRLFVSSEESGLIEVTVSAVFQPSGIEERVICAVYDGNTCLTTAPFTDVGTASIAFQPTADLNTYSFRTGLDADSDGTLSQSECFLIPTNIVTTAFSDAHYDDRREYLNDRALAVYPVASSLLRWFLARTDLPSPFDGMTSQAINCFAMGSLTHNAGASFQSDGTGTLVKPLWNADSTASSRIADSDEMESVVNSIITDHLPEITSHFAAFPTTNQFAAAWTTNSVFVNFSETDYVFSPIEFDLHSAFGRTVLPYASISVVVKKNWLGSLYIDSLTLTGVLEELYDFDFEAGGFSTSAAAVQIGYEFMRTGRDAGRIFFDRTDFWKEFDNWDFDFP